MKKVFVIGFLVCLIVFLSFDVSADIPVLWSRIAGGDSVDYGEGVTVDSDGNVIVVGYTNSSGVGNFDVWTVKYDPNGNHVWNRTAGGGSSDYGLDVTVDAHEDIIVTGSTTSFGAGGTDIWTIKYNPNGNQLWNKTIGGISEDGGYGVAVDSENNIFVVGYTFSFGAGSSDFWVIKYNSNGNLLWNKTLGGYSVDKGYGIAVDSLNRIIVTGSTRSFGSGGDDVWVVWCYGSSGNCYWNETAGGSDNDIGESIVVDSNNSVVVTGRTKSFGTENGDVWTIKFLPNRYQAWNKTLGGNGSEHGNDVAVDSKNNILVTGYTNSSGAGDWDFWTIKYDSDGNQLWNRTLGRRSLDSAESLAVDSNDNIIVTGWTNSSGAGSYDMWTIKYGLPVCDDGLDNDGNGLTDCEEPECLNTPLCEVRNRFYEPQPTIVTLQGKLSNSTSGATISTASMHVTIQNSTNNPVWDNSFGDVLTDGVFNIPLGASKALSLVPGEIYQAVVRIDVGSVTYVSSDVIFGDNSPAGDVIKFKA